MSTIIKDTGIEFADGTTQTTAGTNTKIFTDLQDTPRDFTRSIVGDLETYISGSLLGSPVTYVGDTVNGRDLDNTTHQNIWDGEDSTYYSMPVHSGWKYPNESWILVSFNEAVGNDGTDPSLLKTKKISKIILTTGRSGNSGMAGYTFGVFGIINSVSTYGTLNYSYNTTSGHLQKHPQAINVPDGEGVRKEILKGTVFGNTTEEDYVPADYIIGTSYPVKHVWKLDTPVEAQHLEFRLSRWIDTVTGSNEIGGIEIFDDADNKYVVRLNSGGTALELSDDHETRIENLESSESSLNDRIAELEAHQRIVLLNQSKFITVNTTNFPRITGINGNLTNWYEADFSKTEWGSVPTNAVPLVWAYGSNGANSSTYLYMTSYGDAVANNPALNAAEQSLGYDHGHELEPSHVAWSGLLIPYQNSGESTPYKLAFRWNGTWYIKVQGYLLPRVPTIY